MKTELDITLVRSWGRVRLEIIVEQQLTVANRDYLLSFVSMMMDGFRMALQDTEGQRSVEKP